MSRTRPQPKIRVEGFEIQMKRKEAPTKTFKGSAKRQKTDHEKVMTLQKQVRSLNKANETHVFDQNIFGAATTTLISGTWPSVGVCLNCPVQGDTVKDRQGAQTKGVGFAVRGTILCNPQELQNTQFRFLVYNDKQNNGTAANTILRSVSENGLLDNTTCVDVNYCPLNPVNKKRFKILHNENIINNPELITDYDPVSGNTSTVSIKALPFKFYIPWTQVTDYNSGNSATATDIQTNCVRLLIIQSAPQSVAAAYASFSVASRFYFKEA